MKDYRYFEEGKYSESNEYIPEHIETELWIGGRDYGLVAVPLTLTPLTYTNEFKFLYPLITRIEEIHIRSHDFKSDGYQKDDLNQRLDSLTNYLHQLMGLRCLQHQKREIHDATILFFETIVSELSPAHIPAGTPASPYYAEQYAILGAAITRVRKSLELNDIHVELNSLLNPVTVDLKAFKNLPQTVIDFDLSLDSPSQWVKIMSGFNGNIGRFNEYALLMQAEIFNEMNRSSCNELLNRIKMVAGVLRSHGLDKMLANTFEDIAVGASSPVRLQRVSTFCHDRKAKYDAKLEALKAQIDGLTKTNKFTEDYLVFRQSLTAKLVSYSLNKEAILLELQQHLKGFPPSTKHIHLLTEYVDACLHRIKQPLPDQLSTAYAQLLSRYESNKKTTKITPKQQRQEIRANFLAKWIVQIENSPEKTYGECYDIAKRNADPETRAILEEKKHMFFSEHQHYKALEQTFIDQDAYLISTAMSGV